MSNPTLGALLRELNLPKVAWTLGTALAVATLLNPIYVPPFVVVVGRTTFVALWLLLAYVAAGQWQQSLLPRWLAQILAVALTAPVAAFAVYLLATDGDVQAIVGHPGRLHGLILITGSAVLVGLIRSLGAQVREREAKVRERDARAQALALQSQLQGSVQQRQALDARLALLTAQIEPHFLFNTLANVQALVESGSPRAAEVLRSLIAYLRAALPRLHSGGGLPTLGNEVELVQGVYGAAASLSLSAHLPRGTCAQIDLPPDQPPDLKFASPGQTPRDVPHEPARRTSSSSPPSSNMPCRPLNKRRWTTWSSPSRCRACRPPARPGCAGSRPRWASPCA